MLKITNLLLAIPTPYKILVVLAIATSIFGAGMWTHAKFVSAKQVTVLERRLDDLKERVKKSQEVSDRLIIKEAESRAETERILKEFTKDEDTTNCSLNDNDYRLYLDSRKPR